MPRVQKVSFPGALGHALAGSIDLPHRGEPIAYALFAHCFTCSKDYKAPIQIARVLAAHGIAVLRFDFTGLGESAGEFAATTFASNIEDLLHAARYLADQHRPPAVLIGHSLGGAAVLHAARQIPSAHALVTIASPASPKDITRHLGDKRAVIEASGEAEVVLAGRPFTLRRSFLQDLEANDLRVELRDLGRALLILHSPEDTTVHISNAGRIFAAARHPKSFIALDGADHLLSMAADARYAGGLIAAWLSRYVEPLHPEGPPGDGTPAAG